MQMNAYLSFRGDCEAAFKFYEECLEGKLGEIFRYAGTPLADQVPADWQNKVMHGSVAIGEHIYDAFVRQSEKIGVFAHGYTYSAHPVCAAVALETLRIYEDIGILDHVRGVAPLFQNGLRRFSEHPLVGVGYGPHEANLFDINAKYGDVVPLSDVMSALQGIQRS